MNAVQRDIERAALGTVPDPAQLTLDRLRAVEGRSRTRGGLRPLGVYGRKLSLQLAERVVTHLGRPSGFAGTSATITFMSTMSA